MKSDGLLTWIAIYLTPPGLYFYSLHVRGLHPRLLIFSYFVA